MFVFYRVHKSFFCVCLLQGTFEKIFSFWPLSKCFELNGNVYEWWFRWKLDRYVCSIYINFYLSFKCMFKFVGRGLFSCPPEKTGVFPSV